MAEPEIEEKQTAEIEFWRDSEQESPEADSIHNIISKFSTAGILLECFNRHKDKLVTAHGRVLELGAGQGWASCFYKRSYPDVHVTTTDISKYAVMSLPKWEELLKVRIDNSYACTSYEIDEAGASLDLVFCYSAAHHFLAHRRTLREIHRVLKPGGSVIYFHEPSTPRYLYSLACRRVNRKRPVVPENVLITSELRKLARETGFDIHVDYYPSLIKRDPLEMFYFFILSRIPILQRLLPCSVNFVFTKHA